jgi:hypothetical protein
MYESCRPNKILDLLQDVCLQVDAIFARKFPVRRTDRLSAFSSGPGAGLSAERFLDVELYVLTARAKSLTQGSNLIRGSKEAVSIEVRDPAASIVAFGPCTVD